MIYREHGDVRTIEFTQADLARYLEKVKAKDAHESEVVALKIFKQVVSEVK